MNLQILQLIDSDEDDNDNDDDNGMDNIDIGIDDDDDDDDYLGALMENQRRKRLVSEVLSVSLVVSMLQVGM